MPTVRKVPELSLLDYVQGNADQKQSFIDSLFSGLKDYGFIILTEHLVNQDIVNKAYEMFMEFYKLPVQDKLKYGKEEYKRQRGYIPFGLEKAVGEKTPDLKEFFHVGRDVAENHRFKQFYPKNVWPDEILDFEKVTTELYDQMNNTSELLLQAIAEGLNIEKNFFDPMIKEGNSILRSIHYPPLEGLDSTNAVRAAAHGDINLITLLVGATDSGLELLDRDGNWLPVTSAPGQIVVDTGDMMSRITNEVLPSTIHRVVNPDNSTSARFSMPYFVHPNPEAELKCIPTCVGEGEKYPPINAQDFLNQRLEEIGLMKS
jgi:isopenicillin N synthase-like dioxygenase